MDYLPSIVAYYQQAGIPTHGRRTFPDRRGEFWVECPWHADQHIGSFSFSERGYRCFSCGASGGLFKLAEQLGIRAGEVAPARIVRRLPMPERVELSLPLDYLTRFQPMPAEGLAYAHGRGLSDETIARWRIGWGLLPWSRAEYARLIIPVVELSRVVGLRGRAVDSRDDAPKWLQSAGSRTTLFNRYGLGLGRDVIVTEAPLAAILAMQTDSGVVAVASTTGCGTWRDDWTEAIRAAKPRRVYVFMDNDPAGEAAGVKVANALLAVGVVARIHRWPAGTPAKYDLADHCLAKLAS